MGSSLRSDTLLLFPLKKELEHFVETLKIKFSVTLVKERVGEQTVYIATKPSFVAALGGHAKTEFALRAQYFIDQIEGLQSVLCLGAGGGLAPSINIFDLVVATSTIEHDFGLKFIEANLPEFKASQTLLKRAELAVEGSRERSYQVHFGKMASGDEDICDPKRAKELLDQTQALAVAWEGAGGARAARFNKKQFLEVRAITDLANSKDLPSFEKNLKACMTNLASFILEFLLGDHALKQR